MKKIIVLSVFFVLNFSPLDAGNELEITSPSKKLIVQITESKSSLKVALHHSKGQVLEVDACRFIFDDPASGIRSNTH